MMILSIIAIVLAVLAIVYSGHVAIVFQRFNDGVKDWANALDESTRRAIDRSARQILRELDDKITEHKENVEQLNEDDDDSSVAQREDDATSGSLSQEFE